jgi:Protein of unknown function (DUF3025)
MPEPEYALDRPPRWERLRLVRHERSTFDARFFEQHPQHWPIARAAATFAEREDWPEPSEYGLAFVGDGPVRFEGAPPRRRRPRGEIVVREELYDAVIVKRRVVPTRPRMWHDFLNALVWATFPRSKLALHTRQHVAIERWLPQGATQLPNARTRELDALALVDEGGVVVLDFGDHQTSMVFGHALFEGFVFGQPAMIARAAVLDARDHSPVQGADALRLADRLLSEVLADPGRIVSPDELPRAPL